MNYLLFLFPLVSTIQSVGAYECVLTATEQHVKRTPHLLPGQVLEILAGRSAASRATRKFQLMLNPKIGTASRGYTAKLRVEQGSKDKSYAVDTATVGSDFSNYALFFEVGKKCILFLLEEKGLLFTTHCSYSESLADKLYPTDLMERVH